MDISAIDSNFRPATLDGVDLAFRNAMAAPFSFEGILFRSAEGYPRRLPPSLTVRDVNEGVLALLKHTAGGCVRFRTDSPVVAVRATLADSYDMNHMPRAASAGFDIYRGHGADAVHAGTAQPNRDERDLSRILVRDPSGENEWTIDFPLYGGFETLEIGLAPGATLAAPPPHALGRIVWYGSSITQGGCASRPGNAFASLVCRELDAEQVNLGFSGSGRGEPAVARIIAGMDGLAAVVMDYDHNAKTLGELAATHEPFYRIVRDAHPDLPVLFVSKPDVWERNAADAAKRFDIIRGTYERAKARGERVGLVDGSTLFGARHRDACTVDGTHPNDLGFARMAEVLVPSLRALLDR